MQKHVNLVDLVKSFPTNIYLQNLASIQPRTSPVKFAHLAEKSGKGSILNLSTKVHVAYHPAGFLNRRLVLMKRSCSRDDRFRITQELPDGPGKTGGLQLSPLWSTNTRNATTLGSKLARLSIGGERGWSCNSTVCANASAASTEPNVTFRANGTFAPPLNDDDMNDPWWMN